MKRLTLRMKLGVGFGSLLLILMAMGSVDYYSIGRLSDASRQVVEVMAEKDMSSQIEAGIEKQSTGVRGFLLTGKEDLLKHDEEGKQQYADNMDGLAKLLVH